MRLIYLKKRHSDIIISGAERRQTAPSLYAQHDEQDYDWVGMSTQLCFLLCILTSLILGNVQRGPETIRHGWHIHSSPTRTSMTLYDDG